MAKKDDAADGDEGEKKAGLSGKLKLVAMILPTTLLVLGAVYMFVLAPSGDGGSEAAAAASHSASEGSGEEEPATDGEDAPAAESTYVAGKLVLLEPVTINLANGHYLKVGVALQATADAGEEVSAAKAADALIAEFSGKTVDEISTQEGREASKKALLKVIKKLYEKKVYELFWTTFVMN